MPIWLKRVRLVVLIIFFISAGGLAFLKWRMNQPARADISRPTEGLGDLRLPAFTLVTQDGRPFTNADLLGKVTIVDFVFTNCPFICPMLTEKMHALATRLAQTPVRFLSISVDPKHDTPEAMRAYAIKNFVDLNRWTFAAGTPELTRAIIHDGFRFELKEDGQSRITLKDGGEMANVVHPPWFALVGPDGRVIGIYLPTVQQDLDDLADRASELARRLKP